ncbi:CBN-GRL-26 protein [Caenorhabditis brenneri]|uniref:CBN-GRL-26 protein n=1 Tax=Caenorhabditis brenneri TaxID=135651 RepID=G0N6P7_CAEBE|nr:CBN-GRL-26 protein [Caenorhabditis brenneri]
MFFYTKIAIIYSIFLIDFSFGCAGLFGGGGGGCCCQSGCGRKKRSVDEEDIQFRGIASRNEDMLCNSPEMKAMILAHMKSTPQASSKALQVALEDHDSHRYVVVCSENPFHYSIKHDSAYCGARNGSHYCQAFAI